MGEARRRRFGIVDLHNDALERLTEADERFFARTGRRHRLRIAGRAEVDALTRIHETAQMRCAPGERLFAVVHIPCVGAHLKAFIANRADSEVDVPEAFISALFDRLSSRGPEIDLLDGELRRRATEEGF
jgi:hypothetical protein